MYFSTGRAAYHVFSHTPGCNESSGTKLQTPFLHCNCLNSQDLHLYSWRWKVPFLYHMYTVFVIVCLGLLFFFFFARLSQNIPVFKSSQRSPAYTQFLTTLLGELHFKNEDLESLTRIFRADSPPEWSVNCKLFCMS